MKTAVDWLQDCLNIHFTFEQQMQFEGLFQQAKEMEKQQIINAWELEGYEYVRTGKEYYEVTFNKQV
jgi:hypothetical protein